VSARAERSFTFGLAWCVGAAVPLILAATNILLPLHRGAEEKAREVFERTVALARARNAVQRVRELEPAAAEARGRLNGLIGNFGADPAAAAPALIKEHFRHAGFEAAIEDRKTADAIAALPGYVRRHWRVQIALRDEGDRIPTLLEAAAALEQRSPLIRLGKFELKESAAGSQERQATIELSILLSK
jgi:hypothetical protein